MSASEVRPTVAGVEVRGPLSAEASRILTPAALEFIAALERQSRAVAAHCCLRGPSANKLSTRASARLPRRDGSAARRRLDGRADPRRSADRRVEITGPVDRKMIINALNSGASVFMADFEDSQLAHLGRTSLDGQINLRRRRPPAPSHYRQSARARRTRSTRRPPTLLVRPRGWHLDEKHFLVDGQPISGSLFDFGLFFFHNAKALLARGTGPLLLSAQDGEPPRGPPVERRLRLCPGGARAPARHHPRHGAHRDAPRRVRDGRDPLRAARALGRPQLRALGLHLQLHQEACATDADSVLPDRARSPWTSTSCVLRRSS